MKFFSWTLILCLLLLPHLSSSGCVNKRSIPEINDPELRDFFIDQFKTSFLKELNMREPPRVSATAKNSVIGQLKSIGQLVDFEGADGGCGQQPEGYRQRRQTSTVEEPRSQVIERIITAGPSARDDDHSSSIQSRSYFNLADVQAPPRTMARATIHLFLTINDPNQNVELRIYKYSNLDEIAVQPVFDHVVRTDSTGQVFADVTTLVRKWLQNPELNYGVLIKAEVNGHSVLNHTLDGSNNSENILLHLEFSGASFSPPWDLVSQRSEQICSHDQHNRNCCRYPLEVTLEQVGFGFVISPKRVNIFHCAGECPFGHLLTSRHAHMIQQANSVFAEEGRALNMGPCCVPTEFQNLTILYMPNEYTVKETTMVNIIALRCGCS